MISRTNFIAIALCCWFYANPSYAFYRRAVKHYLPKMGRTASAGLVGALGVEAFLNTPCLSSKEEKARRNIFARKCDSVISGSVSTYCLWGLARIAGFRRVRAPGIKLEQIQHRFAVAHRASMDYCSLRNRRELQLVLGELRSLRCELPSVQTEFEVREDDKQYTCAALRDDIDTLEEEVDEILKQIDGR